MEPLKTFFSDHLVKRLAADLTRAHPSFPARVFLRDACHGLEQLELLDRARHIARALAAHLPPAYPEAIRILLASLGPRHRADELTGGGMASFFYMPHTLFVAEHGLDHFDLSMQAQYELTKRFTAEFSIRPYIDRDPERVMHFLARWANDPDAHVRRLVSEGTRLRLPWARRVTWLDKNPERVIALIDQLKDDPSTMVRRSVANNLNDMGKVHPDLLVHIAEGWLENASPDRRKLVEHALRSAVKRGNPKVLALLGYGQAPRVAIEDVSFTPRRVRIGERVKMAFELRSTATSTQQLLVDVAVHFVKARGTTAPKVFKLGRFVVEPGVRVTMKASFSMAVHTTRVPRPGLHAVDVLVNGKAFRAGAFDVLPPG